MDRNRIFQTVILGILFSFCLASIVWGLTPQRVAKQAFPSVVLLVMEDANGQPLSLGSGFFVRKNVIATNMHVIEGATGGYAKVINREKIYDISGTVGISKGADLALLLTGGTQGVVLPLGSSRNVQVGDDIYAIGNPLGFEGTFTKGIVSGVHNIESEIVFQITAPLGPGSSGGPVLNAQGEVIGISVATQKEEQNINFAIPINYLNALLSKITPVKALSVPKQREGLFRSFGVSRLRGVVARKIYLKGYGYLEYSLYNQLREPIENVHILIIHYDKEGYPLDTNEFLYEGVIRPKLSQRLHHTIGNDEIMKEEWGEGIGRTKKAVEVRILGYKIVGEQ